MQLKQSFIIALFLGIGAVTCWELYWRSQGVTPNLDDNKNLWANQRAKLDDDHSNMTVFIGSSRILYDIQLDIWEDLTDTEPVMLALQGSSPIPVLKDIVENTDFDGTLIVGITPPLLFSTLFPEAFPISRPQTAVNYHYERTIAQRINHKLSIPLQTNLAFIRDGDEEWDTDVDLETLLSHIQLGERAGPHPVPFNNFEEIKLNRHMKMPEFVEKDTAYANTIKAAWKSFFTGDMPPPEKEATTNTFAELAKKYMDRGGNLILIRCPSSGFFAEIESKGFPRAEYWDVLVEKVGAKAYHYDDYPQFRNLFLPEWSHLATKDAQFFTREMVKIMIEDNALPSK